MRNVITNRNGYGVNQLNVHEKLSRAGVGIHLSWTKKEGLSNKQAFIIQNWYSPLKKMFVRFQSDLQCL